MQDAERQLAEGRTGLEGLVGNASSLDTLQTLNDLLAITSGVLHLPAFPLLEIIYCHGSEAGELM